MRIEQHIRNSYVTALGRGKLKRETTLNDQTMIICGEIYEAWKDINGVPFEYHTEIADIFISSFTYCGMIERYEVEMNGYLIEDPVVMFREVLKLILDNNFSVALGILYKYCVKNDIDIDKYIELKIEYNRIRKDW